LVILGFTDDSNTKFIIQKSYRKQNDDPWIITDVYITELSEQKAFKTEDNRKFIKLVFPLREGKTWDGNIHFDDRTQVDVFGELLRIYEGWNYTMSKEETSVNGIKYSEAVRVDHINKDDGLVYANSYEYYAKDIGLVYKSFTHLDTQELGSTKPWEEKAEKGFIVEQKLVSFTK